MKTIGIRGKKEIVAVYNQYAQISGHQDTGRPQATLDFVNYIARLDKSKETATMLKLAAKAQVDCSDVEESAIPSSMKIPVEVEETVWERAMDVFQYVFELKTVQMPFFIRVAGMACIRNMQQEKNNLEEKVKEIETDQECMLDNFKKLSAEDKLLEIYRFLLEIRNKER